MTFFEASAVEAPLFTDRPVISVGELNRLVRAAIEQNLPLLWVAGEISNLRRYDSGHWYFTLKDAAAQVDCVMFRHKAQHMDWQPTDGMKVEVRALATVYEARGKYQLNIEAMRRAGLGALYEAYERLKAKLEAEGLFAETRKREMPQFPRAIGVVTSLQAAALRDVLTTLQRRMPSIPVVLYPTPVQGEGSAAKIMQAIATASTRAEQDQCDVLIVCRGGGSIEDLWSFNEEVVARAIHACSIPVVTGVGHETDFTIADFVADARAPTPTAAAELVSPDRTKLRAQVMQLRGQLTRGTRRALEDHMQKLDYLQRRLMHPGERIAERQRHLVHLANRLTGAYRHADVARVWTVRTAAQRFKTTRPDLRGFERHVTDVGRRLHEAFARGLERAHARLARSESHINALDPQRMLERGYSIAQAANGVVVRDAAALAVGDEIRVTFARGAALTEIKSKAAKGE
ncbi:MAG TPA: exodeoxyribonuclease VII large subunit [Burkholderiales bacterium]|nr:exodeoxyribonuclease VII large subunit [Burkholderiales bacterium]